MQKQRYNPVSRNKLDRKDSRNGFTFSNTTEIYRDTNGKGFAMCFKREEENITIFNIHAPNDRKERVIFFSRF